MLSIYTIPYRIVCLIAKSFQCDTVKSLFEILKARILFILMQVIALKSCLHLTLFNRLDLIDLIKSCNLLIDLFVLLNPFWPQYSQCNLVDPCNDITASGLQRRNILVKVIIVFDFPGAAQLPSLLNDVLSLDKFLFEGAIADTLVEVLLELEFNPLGQDACLICATAALNESLAEVEGQCYN